MISPGRKRRRTIEPLLRARNVPELPAKIGSLSSSSGDSRSPCGSRTSSTLLLVSAPVGHETMHSPQPTHVECPMGTSASNAMAAPDPLPIRPMTKFCSEVKQNFVIGRMGKGSGAAIAFDADVPMGHSTCVGCGECMVSCPTGALTNKSVLDVRLPQGDLLSPEELLRLPIFAGRSGTFLALNKGSIVRRRIGPREMICREGEHGSTAFYVLSGQV